MLLNSLQRSRSQHISNACFETLETRRLMSFAPATTFPVGANPQDVVTADFNNDGKLDLATSGYFYETADGSVSVLLGNGNGSFQPAKTSATGPYPFSLTAGDFNSDGNIDLATANQPVTEASENDVSILLGNGDGTFADPVDLNVHDAYSWSITTGDLNADGKLDLVVTSDDSFGSAYLSVLLGNGDATFATTTYGPYYGQLFSPVLADVNADGSIDVAVAAWQLNTIKVLLGDGTGALQEFADFPATGIDSYGPDSIAIGDFNTDGKVDLVTTTSDGIVSMLLGNGDGIFTMAWDVAMGAAGSANAIDVNADGKLDLVVANRASLGTVTVRLGDGKGGLTATFTTATGGYPSSLVMGDFNGDGRPDAAAANLAPGTVAVLLNDGNWPVQPAPPRVSISDVAKAEGKNKATTSFTFTISLSAAFNQPVTVSYRTVNGTASSKDDYVAKTGTITFAPGQTTQTITIQVKGDNKRESNETFYLDLFGLSSNAQFTKNRGIGTILNDD
jgi:hypothetical protein